jgi:hypothetical protein
MTDIVERLKSWDRCYPGNINVETAVDDATDEINRLRKYEELVRFIANDYHELSYDKAQWQRDDWKKRCKKLLQKDILTKLMQSDSHLI